MAEQPNPKTVWPTLNYADALHAIGFLESAFGFEQKIVVANEADPSVVEHAQLHWPEGGGIMLGTADRPDNPFSQRPTGAASTYVVTDPEGNIWSFGTYRGED